MAGAAGTGEDAPGIEDSGAAMAENPARGGDFARWPAFVLRSVGRVAVHRVAHRAVVRFLAYQAKAWFVLQSVDDEAHHDALHPARGVKGHEPDVMLRESFAAT